MTDLFGTEGDIQHRVWSHVLSEEDESELVEAVLHGVVDLAGLSDNEIMAASRLAGLTADERRIREPRSRLARMLRLYAMRAAQDKRITIDELRRLIRVAELLARS